LCERRAGQKSANPAFKIPKLFNFLGGWQRDNSASWFSNNMKSNVLFARGFESETHQMILLFCWPKTQAEAKQKIQGKSVF
jgi:hypothetical protein